MCAAAKVKTHPREIEREAKEQNSAMFVVSIHVLVQQGLTLSLVLFPKARKRLGPRSEEESFYTAVDVSFCHALRWCF